MELTDMKRAKPKKSDMPEPVSAGGDYEKYPWGLRINLNTEELDKLGMKTADFPIGKMCMVQCQAEVVGVRESERAGDKKPDCNVELQIQKMNVHGSKKGHYQEYMDQKKKGPGGVTY